MGGLQPPSPTRPVRLWLGVVKSAERYDLAKTKYTESLAEYLFTHIVKYGGVIILKEVTHIVRKKR